MTSVLSAIPRSLFTSGGFLEEMRRRGGGAREAALLTHDGSALAPAALDDYPDPAVAWVAGMYALVFRRRADRHALHTHVRYLRAGGDPATLLDQLMGSPEAWAAGVRSRPSLPDALVTGAYLILLGRMPDPAGLATHVAAIGDGVAPAGLLERLWTSEEGRASFRSPPPAVDELDILARMIQSVALRRRPTPETTAWAKDALERGVSVRRVIRSLALQGGRSVRAAFVVLTARPRATATATATVAALAREEQLRDRVWQWQLHRATAQHIERLQNMMTAADESASS